jgi:hypothetical protein
VPYIEQAQRAHLDGAINNLNVALSGDIRKAAGEINYVITRLLNRYITNYFTLALLTGVLVTCLLEFYRRKAVPYENLKIEENGDVYE